MFENPENRTPKPYETPCMEIVALPAADIITDSWSPYI